jgi:CheY-like chemotaxis protein
MDGDCFCRRWFMRSKRVLVCCPGSPAVPDVVAVLSAHHVAVAASYDACAEALLVGDAWDVLIIPVPRDVDCQRLLRMIGGAIVFAAPAVVLLAAGIDAYAIAAARRFAVAGLCGDPKELPEAVVTAHRPMRYRMLLVEDYPDTVGLISQLLDATGVPVDLEVQRTAAGGWDAWQARRHDLAILDLHLPDYRGDQLMLKMLAVDPSMVCIIASAHIVDPRQSWSSAVPLPLQLYRAGAWEQLAKPFRAVQLRQTLFVALQHLQGRGATR